LLSKLSFSHPTTPTHNPNRTNIASHAPLLPRSHPPSLTNNNPTLTHQHTHNPNPVLSECVLCVCVCVSMCVMFVNGVCQRGVIGVCVSMCVCLCLCVCRCVNVSERVFDSEE